MKKEWINPSKSNLGLENTLGVNAIIIPLDKLDGVLSVTWECPCCHTPGTDKFASEADAQAHFKANHLPICKMYDDITDSCKIS